MITNFNTELGVSHLSVAFAVLAMKVGDLQKDRMIIISFTSYVINIIRNLKWMIAFVTS